MRPRSSFTLRTWMLLRFSFGEASSSTSDCCCCSKGDERDIEHHGGMKRKPVHHITTYIGIIGPFCYHSILTYAVGYKILVSYRTNMRSQILFSPLRIEPLRAKAVKSCFQRLLPQGTPEQRTKKGLAKTIGARQRPFLLHPNCCYSLSDIEPRILPWRTI